MGADPLLDRLLHTAREAADAAAAVHRRDAGKVGVRGATLKARADYVSQTDVDAQAAAIEVILRDHPDHAVLAEESDEPVSDQVAAAGERPLWIVDPLDGTANFLHGHPQHCASVAASVDGRVVAGAVACAPTGERWWATQGRGAFKNGRPMSVSQDLPLIDSLIGTGFPFKALDELPAYLGEFDRVLRSVAGVRRAGSAALDLCYLAQGSLDAFWERVLMPWDFAAGLILVREAGGIVTRIDGSDVDITPGSICGANGSDTLHALRNTLAP